MNTSLLLALILTCLALTGCGGGKKDPAAALAEINAADARNNRTHVTTLDSAQKSFTLAEKAEANRHELALRQQALQEQAAAFAGELKKIELERKREDDRRSAEYVHALLRYLLFFGGSLAAALYAFFLILNHRAADIAHRRELEQKGLTLKAACEILKSSSEDVQKAVLLRMTGGLLPQGELA